jgi:hypothetical protein
MHSPDLTSCDILLWGLGQRGSVQFKSRALDELEQQIRDVFTTVSLDFSRKSVDSRSLRSQKYTVNAGACVKI